MKSILLKIILILVMLIGLNVGLSMYDSVLLFMADMIRGVADNWILMSLVFVINVMLAKSGVRFLVKELSSTTAVDKIYLLRLSEFFIAGFLGCYLVLSITGSLVLSIYLIVRQFLIL